MVQWILTAGCGEGRINGFIQSHTNMQQGSTTVSQVVTVVAKKKQHLLLSPCTGPRPHHSAQPNPYPPNTVCPGITWDTGGSGYG